MAAGFGHMDLAKPSCVACSGRVVIMHQTNLEIPELETGGWRLGPGGLRPEAGRLKAGRLCIGGWEVGGWRLHAETWRLYA